LFNETNQYLKDQSIKDFMLKGVDLIDKGKDPESLKPLMEEALSKDLKIDLGIDY
jgi:flagellar motor component MotA